MIFFAFGISPGAFGPLLRRFIKSVCPFEAPEQDGSMLPNKLAKAIEPNPHLHAPNISLRENGL